MAGARDIDGTIALPMADLEKKDSPATPNMDATVALPAALENAMEKGKSPASPDLKMTEFDLVQEESHGISEHTVTDLPDLEVESQDASNSNTFVLDITPIGQMAGKERKEPRFSLGGVVFVHRLHNKIVLARSRDLSYSGVGIEIRRKLKSYKLG